MISLVVVEFDENMMTSILSRKGCRSTLLKTILFSIINFLLSRMTSLMEKLNVYYQQGCCCYGCCCYGCCCRPFSEILSCFFSQVMEKFSFVISVNNFRVLYYKLIDVQKFNFHRVRCALIMILTNQYSSDVMWVIICCD